MTQVLDQANKRADRIKDKSGQEISAAEKEMEKQFRQQLNQGVFRAKQSGELVEMIFHL